MLLFSPLDLLQTICNNYFTNMSITNLLQQAGHRVTTPRLLVAENVGRSPMTAEEIFSKIQEKTDFASIYRTLHLFLKLGYVREVEFGDGKKRYERADLPHHHHLVCKRCDSISDVEVKQNLKTEEQRISKEYQFLVTNHALEFYGLCKNCQ